MSDPIGRFSPRPDSTDCDRSPLLNWGSNSTLVEGAIDEGWPQ